MQHFKILKILKPLRFYLNISYLRMPRTFFTKFNHLINILCISLKKNLNPAILEIPGKTLDIVPLCVLFYKRPKKNTLHSSININSNWFLHIYLNKNEFIKFCYVYSARRLPSSCSVIPSFFLHLFNTDSW